MSSKRPSPATPPAVSAHELEDAIADILFGADKAGRPAYALIDDDAREALGERFEVSPRTADWLVRREARSQIRLNVPDEAPFRRLAAQPWRPTSDWAATPPGLATLVTLSAAANDMHADSDVAAHNYYTRLHARLETPESRMRAVEANYRKFADDLWRRLNAWLEYWEGARGVPTAYALGNMRYVGLPLSQAVIRREDRDRLPQFFGGEALPAGIKIPNSEIEVMLDQWMARSQPLFTSPLRALWSKAAARDQIADAVATELEAWDGSGFDVSSQGTGRARGSAIRLVARMKTFPTRKIEFDLSIPGAVGLEQDEFWLATSGGEVGIGFIPGVAGRMELADRYAITNISMVGEALNIRCGANEFSRRPRRVVPLRFDDLSASFVETEIVQLGEPTIVVVTDDLTEKTRKVLESVARTGWSESSAESLGGPNGWTIFTDVEIYGRADSPIHIDLECLRPRAALSLSISGGRPIPGLLRKWSTLAPPEIHVTSADAQSIRVEVSEAMADGAPRVTLTSESNTLVHRLSAGELSDGEYTVRVKLDSKDKVTSSALLRLRSAYTPEHSKDTNELVHGIDASPLWPITADAAVDANFVDGVRVDHVGGKSDVLLDFAKIPKFQERRLTPARAERVQISTGTGAGESDCFTTGRHRTKLPDALGGKPTTATIEGVCEGCGLVRRYPTSHFRAKARTRGMSKSLAQRLDLAVLPPVARVSTDTASITFDSICHVGNGSIGAMSRLVAPQDGSTLGQWNYLNNLVALGHVDVRRNPLTLDIEHWEVSPSTLLMVGADDYRLVGRRSQPELGAFEQSVLDQGGTVRTQDDNGIPRVAIRVGEIDALVARATEYWPELAVSRNAAATLAQSLPPLSQVAAGLPRFELSDTQGLEQWNNTSAQWEPRSAARTIGAYRFGRWTRIYVVRDQVDIEDGTARRATAELAKHIAALWAEDPLVGYYSEKSHLLTPIGANLPGLYGRAATIASGDLPKQLGSTRVLGYANVSPEVASGLITRLTS